MSFIKLERYQSVAKDEGMRPGVGNWLAKFVLSSDPQQRVRITRSLLSASVFFVCVGLIVYCQSLGLIEPSDGNLLAVSIFISCVGFYAVLRSGFNLRFEEPSLTFPQIIAALTWIAFAYGIINKGHGGTLMLVSLVLVFGLFNMSVRNTRISGAYAVVAMGVTMVYKSMVDPQHYPASIELMYFVFVATIVPTIAVLASQLHRMRQRLKAQKDELTEALERIREMATRDELTGLINRRQMMATLAEHATLCERSLVEFSVAMLDLDFFKKVNDTYGHGVGDEVLRGFAAEARQVLREVDVVARWGGEEFMVLVPSVPPGHPNVGIERLRTTLASLQLAKSVPELRMGFSAGITTFRTGEKIEEAIERADKALYQAKAAGRNRSVLI